MPETGVVDRIRHIFRLPRPHVSLSQATRLLVWKPRKMSEANGILPQAIRSAELRVRLPRHHIDMLHYRADQQETTVSGVLERELDGVASAHVDELSAALPGFSEAMAWPGD